MYIRLPRIFLGRRIFAALFFYHTSFCSATPHLPDYAGIRVENEALLLVIPPHQELEQPKLILKTLTLSLSDLEATWDGKRDHLILEDLSARLGTVPIKGRLEYGYLENPSNWFMKLQIGEYGGSLLDLQSLWNEIYPLPIQMKEGFFSPKNRGIEIDVYSHDGVQEQFLRIEGTLSDVTVDWTLGGIQVADLYSEVLFDQKNQELCFSQVHASFLCGKKLKEYLLLGEKIRFHGQHLRETEFQLALLRNQKELIKMDGGITNSKSVSLDLEHSHLFQKNLSSFSLDWDPRDQSWHLDCSALPDIKKCRVVYRDGKIEIEQFIFREMELFGHIEANQPGWKCPSLGMEIAPFLLMGLTGEWNPTEEKATGSIKHGTIHLNKCPLLQELPCKGIFLGSGDFTFCHKNEPRLSLKLRTPNSADILGELEGTITPHPEGWRIMDCRWKSPKSCFFFPEILVKSLAKSFFVSCADAECTNWIPNRGECASWQAGVWLPKISLKNFSAQLDDPNTWQGEGSLLFRNNCAEKMQEDSMPIWLPSQGEIFYCIQDGKIWLTRLKDGVNQKNSVRISLASSERSWLDFEGRLAIYLRVKPQNPLLKAFEPLSIVLNGDVEHVQCTKQAAKKQRALPRTLKKITQQRKREK